MIVIDINQEDLIDQYSLSKSKVEDVIDTTIKEITARFYERWQEQAQLDLHSTRQRYINNLSVPDCGRLQGVVILDYTKDPLIKMLEEGASAFDMKENFEKSNHVKYNKAGDWYLTIPLKVGAPDTIGDTFGSIVNLPRQVYNVVKSKTTSPLTGKTSGLSSTEIPDKYKAPKTRAKIEIPKSKAFEEYTHKSSIYQGVYKQVDLTTGKTSGFGNFRRVGANSDDNAFIHPGIEAMNLAQKALDQFETIIEQELTRALNIGLQALNFEE